MKRWQWAVLSVLLIALDVYLVGWRWSDVGGNVEAQFIIVTPAFLVHHLVTKHRQDRQHAETQARLDAQDQALAELHQRL